MREASAIDVRPELPNVRCPVLVLHRTDATVIPLEISRALASRRSPDARLELLPGTTASLFFEDPEGVADRIATFAAAPTTAAPGAVAANPSGHVPGGGRRGARRPARSPRARRRSCAPSRSGDTNAEIAASLGISVNTVERHVSNVYRKIDARGRADATAWALRHGLG